MCMDYYASLLCNYYYLYNNFIKIVSDLKKIDIFGGVIVDEWGELKSFCINNY